MNVDLFDRVPSGMRLTDAGKLLLEEIRIADRRFDRINIEIDALKELNKGHIAIGVVECFARQFLPDLVVELRQDHPGLTADIHVDRTSQLADKLLGGGIDLALAFDMPPFPEFRILADFKVPVGVVFSPSHPLADGGQSLTLAQCLSHDLLVPEKNFGLFRLMERIAAGQGIRLHPAIVANSIESLKMMVRNGCGISFMTAMDVYDEITRAQLCFRPVELAVPLTDQLTLCANSHRDHHWNETILVPAITRHIRMIEERLYHYLQQPVRN